MIIHIDDFTFNFRENEMETSGELTMQSFAFFYTKTTFGLETTFAIFSWKTTGLQRANEFRYTCSEL